MDQNKMQEPDVGYLITNISYAIRQYFGNLFAEYDVTYPQSRVLTRLFNQLGRDDVNQRDLEHALGIKASSVSSLVRNLEQKGLIYSERMPHDTRNKRRRQKKLRISLRIQKKSRRNNSYAAECRTLMRSAFFYLLCEFVLEGFYCIYRCDMIRLLCF